jgi:hypothetical protein
VSGPKSNSRDGHGAGDGHQTQADLPLGCDGWCEYTGDAVTAYDPATGKSSTQAVEVTSIHHDNNLVDITLRTEDATGAPADGQPQAQRAAIKAHGSQAPPSDETIHTTTNHPWQTADRGRVQAGDLQPDKRVVTLNGKAGTMGRASWPTAPATKWVYRARCC